ncbi:hypothetical protein [Afifella pfennigii]|uniref:hypothetical protein n=1 Tax=Afifella pfennigii TaxID=209897 RepID=UPI00047A7D35|nr:hypothetical protein [Afifella pfennigii]
MIEAAIEALPTVFSVSYLGYLMLGVVVGLVVGMLPGLGGIVGWALNITWPSGIVPGLLW